MSKFTRFIPEEMPKLSATLTKTISLRHIKRVGDAFRDKALIDAECAAAEALCAYVRDCGDAADFLITPAREVCGDDPRRRVCCDKVCPGCFRPARCTSVFATDTEIRFKIRYPRRFRDTLLHMGEDDSGSIRFHAAEFLKAEHPEIVFNLDFSPAVLDYGENPLGLLREEVHER